MVFVKAPRRGAVKSRLAGGLGAGAATAFYRQTVARLLRRLGAGQNWRLWLAVTPDRDVGASFWPAAMARLPQGRGDIGQRMLRPFQSLPPGPVVVIGSDIPELGAAEVTRAFAELRRADAVFGPARDGGFWLIGLRRRPLPAGLFRAVRWSGPWALADTLRNLKGRRVALLAPLSDVDTLDDWRDWRYRVSGRVSGQGLAPAHVRATSETVPRSCRDGTGNPAG